MNPDWSTYTVDELQKAGCLLVEDGNHGEYRPRPHEFGPGATTFIRASDISDGRVLFESAEHINDVALRRIRKGVGRGGDILFSHKGTVGKLALVSLDAPPFVCSPQTTFWRTLDESRLDRRFLYYFMTSRSFVEQWHSRKGETDMADYVSLTAQRKFSVAAPLIEEQRAIAGVIGALDAKIELNRQMNRTLRATAEALFTSWFTDFDPVVAKVARRRPYGMTPDTADLFPQSFVDSDLGPIPDRWRVMKVGEVVELVYGKALPHSTRRAGRVPVYGSDGQVGWHDEALIEGPGIVVGRKGNAGAINWSEHAFFPIDTTFYVRPRTADYGFRFLYGVLRSVGFETLAGDSAVPGLNRDLAYSVSILVPSPAVAAAYERLVTPLQVRLCANDLESNTLAVLRDSLLPRLFSGELRVRLVEKLVEQAV